MTTRAARIAVTGLGAVTSLGHNAQQSFARLCAGESGIGALTELQVPGLQHATVAEVRGVNIAAVAPAGLAGVYSRADAFALMAAREALAQAQANDIELHLALGTTGGGVREAAPWLTDCDAAELDPAVAQKLVSYPLSGSANRLCAALEHVSHASTFCSACSSGATAIVQAALWIAAGRCACALAGGTEALSYLTLAGFSALGAMSTGACRPFDAARTGMTLGEGAGFLVLESEEHARARGARVLAWLNGWSLGAEAHHITHPEPEGKTAARLIGEALARAGIAPNQIDYFNVHGTGTVPNDAMETRALRLALGEHVEQVAVSSVKGQLGHTLGAAGAIEAVVTVLALQNQLAPPTVGLVSPGEDTALNHVIGCARPLQCRHAASSSFGFGGLGAVLAFSRADLPGAAPAAERRHVVVTATFDAAHGDGQPENTVDPLARLDPERSRRFDRLNALACLGVEHARLSARRVAAGCGLCVGNELGNTARLAATFARMKSRGPRGMAPAEFPQLVHSAIAGNASIYTGLTGPATTVSSESLNGALALQFAFDLVQAGESEAMVAGEVRAQDDGSNPVHDPFFRRAHSSVAPQDESSWLVVESEDAARERNQPILGWVRHVDVRRENWCACLLRVPRPAAAERTLLLLQGVTREALLLVPELRDWHRVMCEEYPRVRSVVSAVEHAMARLASGPFAEALVLSHSITQNCVISLARDSG